MSHRKSSRNRRKKSTDDDNVKMMRVCKLNKTVTSSEIHGTSIYEIDIKSSVNFCNETADSPLVKLCIANVAPIALEKKNTGLGVEFSIVENPFIESHYPRFREAESESERKPPGAEKTNFVVQSNLFPDIRPSYAHGSSKKENPSNKEKEGTQSEAPDSLSKLKRQVKKQIFKGLLAKTDSAWTVSASGSAGNPENALLHLHHHEHHHHYHFDKNKQRDGDDSNLHSSKPSSCESREALTGGRKRISRRRKPFDEDSTKHTYFYTCDSKSNANVTKVLINADADVFPDPEQANRSQKAKPSPTPKAFRPRASSSSESIRNKKSYLLKTHNYSDTDLTKCDSDLNVSDPFRLDLLKKKDSKTNYPSLVSSLKNPSQVRPTSLEVTDQKSYVKSVYIKCKYPVVEPSGSSSTNAKAETLPEAEKDAEEMEKKDSDTTSFALKRSNNGSLDAEPLQAWAEKIKNELKEIKKTLRIIEKEFLKKKNVQYPDINDAISKSEDGSGHEISVFSSRTFILRAENFYIIEESDSGALSEDIESFFENEELCYAETERGHFFLSPNGSWVHFKNEERGKKHI